MKILMVCLGNICRSPMADGLLRHKFAENNLNFTVDSAGTSSTHVGQSPDKRMQKTAHKNGISIENLRARQFKASDFQEFDKIFVMDSSNYEDVSKLARSAEDMQKVDLILNISYPGEDLTVPDPYFGGEEGFQHVFNLLDEATDVLIQQIIDDEKR